MHLTCTLYAHICIYVHVICTLCACFHAPVMTTCSSTVEVVPTLQTYHQLSHYLDVQVEQWCCHPYESHEKIFHSFNKKTHLMKVQFKKKTIVSERFAVKLSQNCGTVTTAMPTPYLKNYIFVVLKKIEKCILFLWLLSTLPEYRYWR